MRTKHLLAFFVAAATLLLPCAAHAQGCSQGACESWATFDPSSGTIYGGSYYENYIYDGNVLVESYIWDPSGAWTWFGGAAGYGYAELDFSGYLPDMDGTYTVAGYNDYEIENGFTWTPDGYSTATVYALAEPPTQDPTPVIQGIGPSPPWQAGQTYNFGVWGTGFGTNPTLTIQWNDTTSYNTSCWGQYCDSAIGSTVTVPLDATDGTITVTSNGYNGAGFLSGGSGDVPTSNGYDVPVQGGVCAVPTGFVQNAPATSASGVLQFTYNFSSTGAMAALASCSMGEIVTFSGLDGNGNFPSPPFPPNLAPPSNPYTKDVLNASSGTMTDTNGFAASAQDFARPLKCAAVQIDQTFRYKCPCANQGQYVNLAKPSSTPSGVMAVCQQQDGSWFYSNSKGNIAPTNGSSQATIQLGNQ